MCELCDYQNLKAIAFLKIFEFHPNLSYEQIEKIRIQQKKLIKFISELRTLFTNSNLDDALKEKHKRYIELVDKIKDMAIEFQNSVTRFNIIIREVIHSYDYVTRNGTPQKGSWVWSFIQNDALLEDIEELRGLLDEREKRLSES